MGTCKYCGGVLQRDHGNRDQNYCPTCKILFLPRTPIINNPSTQQNCHGTSYVGYLSPYNQFAKAPR